MTLDHEDPTRAAPETYDRDWFLAQLSGRDPNAARVLSAPSVPGRADAVAAQTTAEPANVAQVEAAPELPAASGDDEVFPPSGASSRGRRVLALAGATAGLVLVASIAFAASGVREPAQPAGAEDRPSATPPELRNGLTATPAPQLTTLPFPGDTPRNSGATGDDDVDDDDVDAGVGPDSAPPASGPNPPSSAPSNSAPPSGTAPSGGPATPPSAPPDPTPIDPTPIDNPPIPPEAPIDLPPTVDPT